MDSRVQLHEGGTPVAMVTIIFLDFQFMSDFVVLYLLLNSILKLYIS